MALPLDLDPRHWIRFSPSGGTSEVVKILGNAGYYSAEAAPPELKAAGEPVTATGTTELGVNGELTVTNPLWFLQKLTSSERPDANGVLKEVPKPAILEVKPASSPGQIVTEEIANEAITEPKLAKEAVSTTKVKAAIVPAVAAEKTVKVGTAGVDRAIVANLTGDETATQKYKIVHNLETSAVTTEFFSDNSGKPGKAIVTPGALPQVSITNLKEIELIFEGTEPKKGITVWCKVEA